MIELDRIGRDHPRQAGAGKRPRGRFAIGGLRVRRVVGKLVKDHVGVAHGSKDFVHHRARLTTIRDKADDGAE